MVLHRDLTTSNGIHGIAAFIFADQAARDAYAPKTTDLHKVAVVGTEYQLLTSLSPVTWEPLGSGGSGTLTELAWANVTDTPTTLVGYGITDAEPADAAIQTHIADTTTNPHAVTASDVGAVVANVAITAGTFSKVTVDAKGLVTAGTSIEASDVPELDATKVTSGVFDIARIPAAALERVTTVTDQAARFGLTSATVQLGDTVKQTDTGLMYLVVDEANLNNAAGYVEYTAGSAASVPWSGVSDKPTTMAGYGITDGYTDADAEAALADELSAKENADPAIQAHLIDTMNPHGTTAGQVGAEPANANIQGHIATTTGNPHNVTLSEVGGVDSGIALADVSAHIADTTTNPHAVTAAQVGAEPANVNIQSHISTTGNPHGATAADVGAAPAIHDHAASALSNDSTVVGLTIKDALETLQSGQTTGGYTDADAQAACVAQTITDGVTTSAPSQDAVFDALGAKEPANANIQGHIATITGNPHSVTLVEVGGVDSGVALADVSAHLVASDNPHAVTAAQVGAEPANANIQTHVTTIGNPHGTTAVDVGAAPVIHDHDTVYEPANTNIQTHIGVTAGNPHGTSAADVGAEPANVNIQSHIAQTTGNPHNVTPADLGFVDSGVPISDIQTHVTATNNPHGVTAAQAGAVAINAPITAATQPKITYDAKGLVTGGAALDAADIPTLDAAKVGTGVFDIARIPAAAIERMVPVADQTARFALTIATVQLGDTVKQLDTGIMYVVTDTANLNSAAGYTEYAAGTAASVPWSGITSKPTEFAPSAHDLAFHSDVSGFSDTNPVMDGVAAQGVSDRISRQDHIHPSDTSREPAFTKNTTFNKNYGTAAGTTCEGNDSRLSDARTPLTHDHTITEVTDIVVSDVDLASLGGGISEVTGVAPISVATGTTTPQVSIAAATTGAAGSMSAADKTKLDGIAAGAQVNVGTDIAEGTRTSTTVPITSSTGTGATLSAATPSLAGVMSSADKTKLDSIINVGTNIAEGARTSTTVAITSSTGTGATLSAATTSLAGVMASADKTKLAGIADGATADTASAVAGAAPSLTGTVGVATAYARSDHAHPSRIYVGTNASPVNGDIWMV
jgi:hypothetical protein